LVETLHQKIQDSPQLLHAVAGAYGSLKKGQPGNPGFLCAAWWLTRLYSTCPGMPMAAARDALHAAPAEPGAWGLLAETPEGQAHLSELVCSERARLLAETPGLSVPALVDALCTDPPAGAAVLVQAAEMLANHAVSLGGSNPKDRVKREFVWAAPLLKNAAAKCGATPAETARTVAACARLYNAAGMWTETETACAEALPFAEPDARVELHLLRSRALVQLSRKDEALAAAREAVQTAPGRWDVQWNLAQRLSEAGMDREAQFVYRMLLQRIPDNVPEHRRVAEEYGRVLRRLQTSASGVAP
jgi:tetratricopeptide (TPR) repeat protein